MPPDIINNLKSNLALKDTKHNQIVGYLLKTQVDEPDSKDKYWKTARQLWLISKQGYFTAVIGRNGSSGDQPAYGVTDNYLLDINGGKGNNAHAIMNSTANTTQRGWGLLTRTLEPDLGRYPYVIRFHLNKKDGSDPVLHYWYAENIGLVNPNPILKEDDTYSYYKQTSAEVYLNTWNVPFEEGAKTSSPKNFWQVKEISEKDFTDVMGFPIFDDLKADDTTADLHIIDTTKKEGDPDYDLGPYNVVRS